LEGLHNLKDRICDFENLMCAYREAAKGKRYRTEVIYFRLNLCDNIQSIRDDLLNETYKVGAYREFYVRYPKPRLVMALTFRDRVVQWAIYRQLNPYVDNRFIDQSYGCRQDKGTLAAAEKLLYWMRMIDRKPDASDYYIIKGDVSKFFYRVDHEEVLRQYGDISDDKWFSWLMGTIINNPDVPFGLPKGVLPENCPREKRIFEVGMPIGNLTSQETANVYLDALDQFVKHVLHVHCYVRYMDDFMLIVKGKDVANDYFAQIEEFLTIMLKLDISPKSRIQKATDPIEFVGYIVTPAGLRLRKKTRNHAKRSINSIKEQYESFQLEYDKALEKAGSYRGLCKHVNAHSLEQWIDGRIQEMEKIEENRFYEIRKMPDGTADVYLYPDGLPWMGEPGVVRILAIRGVVVFENMEEDIRLRYGAWCASAEPVVTIPEPCGQKGPEDVRNYA